MGCRRSSAAISPRAAARTAVWAICRCSTFRSYALLDLRAGVATSDGKWRFSLWGHNVTNKYYWTIADHIADTTVRFAGMPATFGVSATYRYK
jgi:outer membrane receptor protein involved in Fe transport